VTAPLLCQEDPYLKVQRATVLGCEQVEGGYEVALDAGQAILFPEAGGQPADEGTLDRAPVRALRRDGDAVVHLVDRPIRGGEEVEVRVAWDRRHDHMQQHTAQHLITALAHDGWGHRTIAFHLSPRRCDIELACDGLQGDQLRELELLANQRIREAVPVTHRWVAPGEMEHLKVRTRGLPDDHTGQVRLVEIQGMDLNTCGGTHVANTAEIQAIKLTGTERLSRGTRLFYLAGHRVLHALDQTMDRERRMIAALTCSAGELPDAVDRLRAEARDLRRQARAQQDDWVQGQVALLQAQPGVASLHRQAADMNLLRGLGAAFHRASPDRWALLTGGETEGVFVMAGPEEKLREAGPRAAQAMKGKGGGAKGIYQGKAADISGRDRALVILKRAAE